jgi:hypothetical protein
MGTRLAIPPRRLPDMAPRHASFVTGTLCPQCSEQVPSEAPEGLCPTCLFAAAMTAPRDPIEDADEDDQATAADDEDFDSPQFGFAETAAAALRRSTIFKIAAARYLPAPPDLTLSLEARFNRSWAINILELALRRVRLDWTAAGRSDEFDRLKYALFVESAADGEQSVVEHGPTSAGSMSPVSLLRRGFHQRLREGVARTVVEPDGVDDEIWELFRALQS